MKGQLIRVEDTMEYVYMVVIFIVLLVMAMALSHKLEQVFPKGEK